MSRDSRVARNALHQSPPLQADISPDQANRGDDRSRGLEREISKLSFANLFVFRVASRNWSDSESLFLIHSDVQNALTIPNGLRRPHRAAAAFSAARDAGAARWVSAFARR